MLYQANIDIQKAVQKARRFTDGDAFHKLMIQGIPYEFDLIEGVPIFCKIECAN